MSRYAQGTTVTVDSSRGEITGILAKFGVQRMAWASQPEGDMLEFQLAGHHYRFTIDRPTWDDVAGDYVNSRNEAQRDQSVAAEWRRRWRANVLLLKAKLEFAQDGPTTIARELMANLVLADGRVMADAVDQGGVKLLAAGA
jgi:hypothetical protein